jgi:predicted transcriptional regulator YheO
MIKTLATSGTPIKDIATMMETTRVTIYRYLKAAQEDQHAN